MSVPTVEYRVQAHPSRQELAERLAARLPPAVIVWDEAGPWSGYLRCLQEPFQGTHLCILQDDATLCRNFVARSLLVVARKPESMISLFVGGIMNVNGTRFWEAQRDGKDWCQITSSRSIDIVHAVGLIWPRPYVESFLEWVKTAKTDNPNSDDAYITAWVKERKPDFWATVPSLVEHRDDVPSTIRRSAEAGRNKKRVAIAFAGE